MSQEHPRQRRRAPFLVVVVVLFVLGLAALLPVVAVPVAAQTLPTRTPQATVVQGDGVTPTPLQGIFTPTPLPAGPPTPIVSGGGLCELIVTDDDGIPPGTVTIVDLPVELLPNRDPRYTYIRACEVIYTDENGQIISNKTFDGPVDACFRYTADDLARAGDSPARLTIVYYDEASGSWVETEVTIDETNGLICGKLPRSGRVALVIRGQAAGLPNTSGNLPDATPVAVADVPAAAPADAPAAAPADAPAAAPADAPAAAPADAPAAAPADAPAAAPALAPAAEAAAAPAEVATSGGVGPVLVLVLGVAAAIFAAILVLSRNMLSRGGDR
jgi:hypothetical protein